ncbi:MAG: cold shock domain-containing protein [Planctomycetes bacterium]|nr:cold shock domain-containing protein [Planctomycetota bacterium]
MPTNLRVNGEVKWYDAKKGYGFILRDGAPQVFLHYSVLKPEEAQVIKPGDVVEFSLEQTDRGGVAKDVRRVSKKKH